jgi:hypothetical protein
LYFHQRNSTTCFKAKWWQFMFFLLFSVSILRSHHWLIAQLHHPQKSLNVKMFLCLLRLIFGFIQTNLDVHSSVLIYPVQKPPRNQRRILFLQVTPERNYHLICTYYILGHFVDDRKESC